MTTPELIEGMPDNPTPEPETCPSVWEVDAADGLVERFEKHLDEAAQWHWNPGIFEYEKPIYEDSDDLWDMLQGLGKRVTTRLSTLATENAQLRELLSCALDEYEGANGRLVQPSPHWSAQARAILTGRSKEKGQ